MVRSANSSFTMLHKHIKASKCNRKMVWLGTHSFKIPLTRDHQVVVLRGGLQRQAIQAPVMAAFLRVLPLPTRFATVSLASRVLPLS